MKIKFTPKRPTSGYILLLVMVMCAVALVILVGVMNRTSTVANLNMRSNQLIVCQNMAEAATEKVYAKMAFDFQANGPGYVSNQLSAGVYHTTVPNTNDSSYFANFNFSDTTNIGYTYVAFLTNYTGPLPTQYSNTFATTSPIYRIVSNVTMPNTFANAIVGTAQEDVLLALVPITTYAIFYNGELEFSDCAPMTIAGRTHSNADICTGTPSSLTFTGIVTCCSVIQSPQRGGVTPIWSFNQNTTYNSGFATNVTSVQIAIPMTNTISIIQIPPAAESPTSTQGMEREYNQAQVVLIITNSPLGGNPAVYLTLQTANNGNVPGSDNAKVYYTLTNVTTSLLMTNTNIPTGSGYIGTNISMPFLTLTNVFYDQRENKTNFVTQIDVGAYANWALTNPCVTAKISSGSSLYPTILYVADRRNVTSKQLDVVRLVNAQKLPYNNGLGFSVATQNPLYVRGDYNTTTDGTHFALTVGSTINGYTVPAALISDALTVLSASWSDGASYGTSPTAVNSNLVLNAAIITGNIPSTGTTATTFSGGVHNLTRYLEDWTGNTTTYNTSIVCLFSSQMATNQFVMPYVASSNPNGYYVPPIRNWGFDPTFYDPNKQPPGVPCALVPIRFNWTVPPPNNVTTGVQ
jgi:hypothetical protein